MSVKHDKILGNGYAKSAPLYARQKAWDERKEKASSLRYGLQVASPEDFIAMNCIVDLTVLFFAVFVLSKIIQSLNQLCNIEREREERCFVAVVETVFFVPMLCILFLAARMRAVQLAQGHEDKLGLPQWWVKVAMVLCTSANAAWTGLTFICVLCYGELWEATAKNIYKPAGMLQNILLWCRGFIVLVIYVTFSMVCWGVCFMPAPTEIWGNNAGPPVSPSVVCTIALTMTYFSLFTALYFSKLWNEYGLSGRPQRFSKGQELLKSATTTMAHVPMICVLFIAVRMRALQLDPVSGDMRLWMHRCVYLCTLCVLAQVLVAMIGAALGVRETGEEDGIPTTESGQFNWKVKQTIITVRLVLMVLLVLGVLGLVFAIFALAPAPVGYYDHVKLVADEPLPMVPASLTCIAMLTLVYFFTHLAWWIVFVTTSGKREYYEDGPVHLMGSFLERVAHEVNSFSPMLCILFLAVLLKALDITASLGAPPKWCQVMEYAGAWSIVLLTVACAGVFFQRKYRVMIFCTGLQYVCIAFICLSAIAVVISLKFMRPEDADGPGSVVTGPGFLLAHGGLHLHGKRTFNAYSLAEVAPVDWSTMRELVLLPGKFAAPRLLTTALSAATQG